MPIFYSTSTGKKKLLRALVVSLTALAAYGIYCILQSDEIAPTAEVLPANPQAPVRFDLLNPAKYALEAEDYGGHPAYGAAMLARGCANYFESRGNHDQDLADAAKLGKSGDRNFEDLVAATAFKIRTMEVQCSGVTVEDIRNSGDLLREAAAAGDVNAKGIVLLEDFRAADAARAEAKLANKPFDVDPAVYKNWLNEAVHLTEQGNLRGAQLAALLTSLSAYGQKDMTASAMWSMVAQQSKGEAFDSGKFSFETEPYNELSSAERAVATERAKNVFEACCTQPSAQDQKAP
ncbi:hypothetical protein NOI24_26090 [Neorhizobium galegae]|uniref:hypothetical protein n=1 Tax=Neorhizobium galegae TaxID=399 RepID=UPI0021072071|nr:hypothetical protein [Neorhizobium galegae]MCQ1774776.1 hypothetical protein [Neorhizobium galegae]MCQ1800062.1 hypothetical protein [Neorhizobium galegae]